MDRNALDPGDDVLGRALARNPSNEDLQLAWLTEIARRSRIAEENAPGPFRQAAPNFMAWVDRIPGAFAALPAGRSLQGAGTMRDHIIARLLDRRANKLESAEATSFLFPDEPGLRSAAGVANYNYQAPRPPAANTNKSLQIDNPFSEARLEQTWAKMVEDMRFAEELARRNPKLLRPFEVIPGGKKD